jgi:autotransporter-associated beta strand protein
MSQPTASNFTAYSSSGASSIVAGPLALYSVNVNTLIPTELNVGSAGVSAQAAIFDRFSTLSGVENSLLATIEPVVIGPGGALYLLGGQDTFTALADSVWGSQNPNVYVDVVANYSSLTTSQFFATMQSNNLLLPLNNGLAETVTDSTGAPFPTSLTGLTNNADLGLEYSILNAQPGKLYTGFATTAGLDQVAGFNTDALAALAYQGAYSGRGLAYVSPYDIANSTGWNLSSGDTTTLPGIGSVTAGQLPGFILSTSITISTVISNTTLGETSSNTHVDTNGHYETGALADNGTSTGAFTGVTEINAGTVSNPILIGTANIGFIMQLGSDRGHTVTLSDTANTYTGGTTILAGHLIVAADGSLGASTTETLTQFNASLTIGAGGTPTNVTTAVQADNGIIFNSLSGGHGTLTIGTSAGQYTSSSPFTTSRPIAVGGQTATLDINGSVVDLNGPLITLGYDQTGLNTAGFPNLTIDDLSSGGGATSTAGKLVLATSSPYFYGDIIIGSTGKPTVEVMSDAALGNTSTISGSSLPIGQVELNGGTLQTGASFTASERNVIIDSSSQIDLFGKTTSWGTLTDTNGVIAIGNSSSTAAAITFSSLTIGQTATVQLDGKAAGTTYSNAETVTFTNGIAQTASTDTLFINSAALGSTTKLFSSGASTTLVNGMAPAWIINDNGGTPGPFVNPYDFVMYGSNGYAVASYGSSNIATATSTSLVQLTASATLSADAQAYALKLEDPFTGTVTITATGHTLTLGDGTHAAGLILEGNDQITGGTLAYAGSKAFIYTAGSDTISSAITGTNGLTLAGSGTLTLSAASPNLSGAITVDSGTLTLTAANEFQSDTAGLTLDDVKSSPSNSVLDVNASQTFTTLDSVGSQSTIAIATGTTLTLGETTNSSSAGNNLGSTISSAITQAGATGQAGVLTLDGSGFFDLSGIASGKLSLVSSSTIVVNNSAQLRVTAAEFANANAITLNGTSQLQFVQNGDGKFAGNITGTGELHLIGGTLGLTGTGNTYSGGTVIELGSTLDVTTATLTTGNANITDAGGLVVFDQSTTGTYSGVISDGLQMGTGASEQGSLALDDYTGGHSGSVTLSSVQTYTGGTYVEAGTLTLGAANTVADSSGVTLGRIGLASTANLVLNANNQLSALSSDTGSTTSLTLNGHVLTLAPASGVSSNFAGAINDGSGAGSIVINAGTASETVTLSGINNFSGGLTVEKGTLAAGAYALGTGTLALANGTTLDLTDNGTDVTNATSITGTVTFDVASGLIASITSLIADGTGEGTLEVAGGGTLTLGDASDSFTGGTIIAGGSTLEIGGAGAAGPAGPRGTANTNGTGVGTIAFSGTGNTLKIDGTTMPTNTIGNMTAGQTIDLAGVAYSAAGQVNLMAGTPGPGGTPSNVLEVTENGVTYSLQLNYANQVFTGDFFHLASDGHGGTSITENTTPCYCRGTLIRTADGDRAIESLGIGDLVTTTAGTALPLKWVGRRSYSDWLAVGNEDIQPILFKAGSIADGIPARDLYVSPEHAMLLDGMLVPAHCLVNGVSIVKMSGLDEVDYFHLEFDRHVVIFAEDAMAESFVDDESRMLFHNADEYRRLYPGERRHVYAEYCAPRVEDGIELDALRRSLAMRAPPGAAAASLRSGPSVTPTRLPQDAVLPAGPPSM